MKKLALALMCLVSVAFFASCDPQGQPTIQVINEEGFVVSGDVVNLNEEVHFGFKVAPSPETKSALSTLIVTINDETFETVDLANYPEYTYESSVIFEPTRDSIIGTASIVAVVTDAAGQSATATITLQLNEPEVPITSHDIEWVRRGANVLNADEMALYGLEWTGSYKDVFATIKPLGDATMYLCNGDDFANINTLKEKAAYFANLIENGTSVESYRKITTNNSADYNDMLAVVYGKTTHLIHIKRAEIETGSFGTQITIKGETK